MTYGRLNHFRDKSTIHALFRNEMEKQERRYTIDTAKGRYDDTPVDRSKKGDDDTDKKNKEKASSRLSLYLFTDEEAQKKQGDLMGPIKEILKSLIQELYQNAPFYKEAQKKNDELLTQLVDSLIEHIEKGQQGVSLSSGKDLANLELGSHPLDEVTYHMLKGNQAPEEDRKKEGYPSLSSFITFKNTEKIRVYLAPKELLNQLFDAGSEVPYILKSRDDLYGKIKAKRIEEKDASKEFESLFRGKQKPHVPDALLDYTVTKSNPKDYS